ncbi:DUF2164 domain-containing protein [Bacillus sp. V5-8f]|uniref:DUF2164 domain-containing protein n=1 Tax=Bacillus sp. V5-8f TaxID=2053044 RepID=UPI0015E0DDDC|nr:DUF2164 domain-containing protein [Bacillus sp. V5-8f]
MFIKFPLDQKSAMKSLIKEYVKREFDEEIGELAAENYLEFIIKEIGPYIYNRGVQDAKAVVQDRVMMMDEDLTSLERPIKN